LARQPSEVHRGLGRGSAHQLDSVRPTTTQRAVADALRREISSGRLAPGSRVVQESLAAQLGVSRLPIRESLKVLEAECLLTYVPHVGYRVPQPDMADLTELFRLRAVLEDEVLRDAVAHTTGRDVESLRAQMAAMNTRAGARDVAAAATTNRQFHQLVVRPSRMARAKRILSQLWNVTEAYRPLYLRQLDPDWVQRQHHKWVDALGGRDMNNVLALNKAHRARTFAHLSGMVNA
jgi:DNA-binding GntR family transcriptional regulator